MENDTIFVNCEGFHLTIRKSIADAYGIKNGDSVDKETGMRLTLANSIIGLNECQKMLKELKGKK